MPNPELFKILADNPTLLAAVKELLEGKFSVDNLKATDSDTILGQMVRARIVGLEKVQEAIDEIARYKSAPTPVDKSNPGK